jgi:hypothetical protein
MATVYPETVFAVAADSQLIYQPAALAVFSQAQNAIEFVADLAMQFVLIPFEGDLQAMTNRLLDENGNILSDESGDRIAW